MRKIKFVPFILILLLSCKNLNENKVEKKSWVYIEIGNSGDEYEDAIYGKVSQNDLNLIKQNSKSEELIKITDGRFINDEGIVKDATENSNEEGTYFHRIKNITYIEVLKNDPINTKVDSYNF